MDESVNHLLAQPDAIVDVLPIPTKAQVLPFNMITWENFENFCFQLGSLIYSIDDSYIYGRKRQNLKSFFDKLLNG